MSAFLTRSPRSIGVIACALLSVFFFHSHATATDWTVPEQQLARKIAAATGPGAVAIEIENRSSLDKKDADAISGGVRVQLEALGLRFVKAEQAAATVRVTLSENLQSYVWVAEIRLGANESSVVMISMPRLESGGFVKGPAPLAIRKIPLWSQEERILDVAVLEEGNSPTHIAVLDAEKVALYRMQDGRWQQEQVLSLTHARPWPRDLRGRLIPAKDHLLDAYLPGVLCQSNSNLPLGLACHESDDPWPLAAGPVTAAAAGGGSGAASPGQVQLKGFFAITRNFFTGVLSPGIGRFTSVPKFYSAAPLPRERYTLWLLAGVDGQVHLVDGVSDQSAQLGWGSDLASVRTQCGSGLQVLATRSGDNSGDSVRAYEFPDRDPVAMSAPVEFAGGVTALWTEAKGNTAIAVSRNEETRNYEAFRLAMACGQ